MKILVPFSWLYRIVVRVRGLLFDWGVLRSQRVGVAVISVGNITTGGTGKTPLVELLVALLMEKNTRVAVVSRGYKRSSRGVVVVSDGTKVLATAEHGGDEPLQIAQKFPEAIVVVGEKRVPAAKAAVALGAEVIVLDDGFQHRYIKREADIVVIDSTKDITKDLLLPAGRLREPLSALRRAHVVAFSKSDEAVTPLPEVEEKLRKYFAGPFIATRSKIVDVRRGNDGGNVSLDIVRTMRLFAFSGIANHESFMHELSKNGFAPVSGMRFPDHHSYGESDVSTIAAFARAISSDACITTEKDIVRLRSNGDLGRKLFSEIPVFYLTIETEIIGGKEMLHTLLAKVVGKASVPS